MLFNSWGYILLLLLAVPLHWALPRGRPRIALLAACSVLFYSMWRWEFSLLVLFSACVDYLVAWKIHASSRNATRRAWLLTSLIINIGLLVFFKYTYFIYDNIRIVGNAAGADMPLDLGLRIILPLGISFYTFQTICYSIDVYRRVIEPTRHFVSFLAYVTFWPQLIAGPILRASEVIPQLEGDRRFSWNDVSSGAAMIVAGLFKKVVLADSLAPMVDEAFALSAASMTALDVWVSTFLFGFQIYFDFAGYSSIAIGSALMVGLRFPANFNWPYMACSPREFWQRWHISLSAWIRDYLYLPLTGQRFRTESTGGIAVAAENHGGQRTRALFLTWFIMGLWHGAGWTFIVWGLYHALLITLFRAVSPLKRLPERLPAVAWGLMLMLSMAGWIPFRAASLGQALTMFSKLVNPLEYGIGGREVDMFAYFWAAAILLGMLATRWVTTRHARRPWPDAFAMPAMAVSLALMVCATLICMRAVKQFIYFQF